MLLTIDVGNTQTHIGMFRGDELAAVLVSMLGLRGHELADVDGAIVSSVVPTLAHEYEMVSERYFAGSLIVIGPGVKTGMPIRTETPQEVGADRLVNAVAAYDRVGSTCVVVDFGTTINYDVVSADGELLGAIFTPGVEISMAALAQRAARLPTVDIEPPKELIGRSTVAAIQSGIVYGFAGQVDGIVGRLRDELGDDLTAIATGGLASSIAPFCEEIDQVDDLLTLTGLRLIWEMNRPDA